METIKEVYVNMPIFKIVKNYIDKYAPLKDVLAWKMPGAGGGGYLACVVRDAPVFCQNYSEAISLKIRRK